jgi:hypothetical protein
MKKLWCYLTQHQMEDHQVQAQDHVVIPQKVAEMAYCPVIQKDHHEEIQEEIQEGLVIVVEIQAALAVVVESQVALVVAVESQGGLVVVAESQEDLVIVVSEGKDYPLVVILESY